MNLQAIKKQFNLNNLYENTAKKVIAFAKTSDGKNILKLIDVAQNNGYALPFKLLDQNFDAIKIETSEKEFKKVFPHIQLKE